MSKLNPRNLDHVVLPVPDLEIARKRMEALGFTVAPNGRHKFGTENACVKFDNGTFIEPLAIGHRETVEANAMKGNNFLRRDAAYRFRNGEDGFWGFALGTQDSAADRKLLKKAGYNTGKLVTVKRKGVHARLAFALDERAPDFSIFMCQDVGSNAKTDPELLKHPNGAIRVSRVTLHEHLPEDFQYYLQTVCGQRKVRSHSFGMEMELTNAKLSVMNNDGMKVHYGQTSVPQGRGLRALAFDIEVQDLEKAKNVLKENGISPNMSGHRLVVEPAIGQGAIVAFVEAKS